MKTKSPIKASSMKNDTEQLIKVLNLLHESISAIRIGTFQYCDTENGYIVDKNVNEAHKILNSKEFQKRVGEIEKYIYKIKKDRSVKIKANRDSRKYLF